MITKEEKEALAEHFKNRDLYDPSKAPEQQPADFAPRCEDHGGAHVLGMCSGGAAYAGGGMVRGYSDGTGPDGVLPDDFSVDQSADTSTARGMTGNPLPPEAPSQEQSALDADKGPWRLATQIRPPMTPPIPPRVPATPPQAGPGPMEPEEEEAANASLEQPDAAPPGAGRLAPNEYDDLVKALTSRPTAGQTSMSALAGLADAIESGVARAPGPGFQKQISENQQKQKENLINALREKYEAGFKGQELGQGAQRIAEEGRHNAAGEKIGSEEAAARLAEAKSGLQQNALEAAGRLTQAGGLTGRILGQPSQTQTAINALMDRAGLGGGKAGAGPTVITTRAQYDALPKGTHYVDSKGTEAVKQ